MTNFERTFNSFQTGRTIILQKVLYGLFLFLLPLNSLCDNSPITGKNHIIIFYLVDDAVREPLNFRSDGLAFALDSLQNIKDKRTALILKKEWAKLFESATKENFFSIVSIKAISNTYQIIGISDLLQGNMELDQAIEDLVKQRNNFDASKSTPLAGRTPLSIINEKVKTSRPDLLFDNKYVTFIGIPIVYTNDIYVDTVYYRKLLANEKGGFNLKISKEISFDAIEFNIIPEFKLLENKTNFYLQNERWTTKDGRVTIKREGKLFEDTIVRKATKNVSNLFCEFSSFRWTGKSQCKWIDLEGKNNPSISYAQPQLFSNNNSKELDFTKFEEGIPIYLLLQSYLCLDEKSTDTLFNDLSFKLRVSGTISGSGFDNLILKDSTTITFGVNPALNFEVSSNRSIALNNLTLLKYAHGEEINQSKLIEKLNAKRKDVYKIILAVLLLLLLFTWYLFFTKGDKGVRSIISKLKFK